MQPRKEKQMRLPNIGLKHTVLAPIKLFEFENWAVIAIGGHTEQGAGGRHGD